MGIELNIFSSKVSNNPSEMGAITHMRVEISQLPPCISQMIPAVHIWRKHRHSLIRPILFWIFRECPRYPSICLYIFLPHYWCVFHIKGLTFIYCKRTKVKSMMGIWVWSQCCYTDSKILILNTHTHKEKQQKTKQKKNKKKKKNDNQNYNKVEKN